VAQSSVGGANLVRVDRVPVVNSTSDQVWLFGRLSSWHMVAWQVLSNHQVARVQSVLHVLELGMVNSRGRRRLGRLVLLVSSELLIHSLPFDVLSVDQGLVGLFGVRRIIVGCSVS